MARRKHKYKLDMATRIVKTVLKASTHVFTVSGIVVATAPLHTGLVFASQGNVLEAGHQFAFNTTGFDTQNPAGSQIDYKRVIGTVITLGIGIGLVAAGAVLRRRIGRSK